VKPNKCKCGTDKLPIGIDGMPSGVCTIHCPTCCTENGGSFAQGQGKVEALRNWNKANPKPRKRSLETGQAP
jgi:hypothetical protein